MDREGGFIVIARRVRSSDLYQSLTAQQRSVFNEILLACAWKPRRMFHAGRWIEIDRGEYVDSLETIAKRARVSVKVVRSTYSKLMTHQDDESGPFMSGRPADTEKGTQLRIIRVLNYDRYQSMCSSEGTGSGTGEGTVGARSGHGRGTVGAPSEPDKPDQPRRNTSAAKTAAVAPLGQILILPAAPTAAPPATAEEAGGAPPGTPAPAPPASRPKRTKQEDPALDALKADLVQTHRDVRHEELDWPKSAWGELTAVRAVLADDDEVRRRWRLFLESKYWPTKSVHKFRTAFQHAAFQRRPAAPAESIPVFTIPEFRS